MQYEPIESFRRLVSLLYREIGVLKPRNHSRIAAKARLGAPFFNDRKGHAKRIFGETRNEDRPQAVVEAYQARTGLTLEDIHEAFERGNWKTSTGRVEFGGPNWAAIARFTLALRDSIINDDQERLTALAA